LPRVKSSVGTGDEVFFHNVVSLNLNCFVNKLCNVPEGFGEVNKGFGEVNEGFGEVNEGFGEVNKGFGEVNKSFGEVNKGFGEVNKDFGGVAILYIRVEGSGVAGCVL
jgi:hypothetical protein